ncbi:MAG: hypothetical protein ACKOW8_10855, partial [Flavobacteriales bacterium]
FSFMPYQIMGMNAPVIEKNNLAQLSCFSTSGETLITAGQLASKARNTPLIGKALRGQIFPLID